MARTTQEQVAGIVKVNATLGFMDAAILSANELVTEKCSESGYSEGRLTLIETWLAAHFYALMDARRSSESAGKVSVSYQNKLGFNLALTHYGQQAMILDTEGNLARLNVDTEKGRGKPVAEITWLGGCD